MRELDEMLSLLEQILAQLKEVNLRLENYDGDGFSVTPT